MMATLRNILAKANKLQTIVQNGEQKMLNLLTKTKPWMVASLIVATSVFGQNNAPCPKPCPPKPAAKPCPQPAVPTQNCQQDPCCPAWPTPVLNAAYNYPARIQTRCPWDVSFDASFIFWQATQDNMELGIADTAANSASTSAPITGNVINMDFDFKPGFQVGMGVNFDYDNWDMHLEYTWFHARNSQSSNGPNAGRILPLWGSPTLVGSRNYDNVSEKWRLNMDIADLDLGRAHYVGTKFTVRPSFGARANWIRQKVTVTQNKTSSTTDSDVVTAKSTSWGIGPKVAVDANWNMGWGFRFFGNSEADLLFTDYNRISFKDAHNATASTTVSIKQKSVYTVKPHVDLGLGLGWGTYLDCNNWYMDFALGYDFQVFFDQNMFRHFDSTTLLGHSTSPNGNLYVQGMTATFKLDF